MILYPLDAVKILPSIQVLVLYGFYLDSFNLVWYLSFAGSFWRQERIR